MKKTFNVDDKLFTEAKAACGAKTDTETVRLGLEALVRHADYEGLRGFPGSTPPYGFGLLPDGRPAASDTVAHQ